MWIICSRCCTAIVLVLRSWSRHVIGRRRSAACSPLVLSLILRTIWLLRAIICASVFRWSNESTRVRLWVTQAELSERKAFLSDSKEVLLGASDALDGKRTRDKMAYDDRAVGANVWMKALVALLDADGSFWSAVGVETGICSHLNPRCK